MNERKEEKRVTSIARKINLQNVGSMLLAYLWVDILVCIVLAAVMIYGLDVQLAGRFDITYARKLMIETSVWDMVYQVGHKGSSVYYLVEIGPWLIWFMIGGCVVLVWELVEIIKKLMRGTLPGVLPMLQNTCDMSDCWGRNCVCFQTYVSSRYALF